MSLTNPLGLKIRIPGERIRAPKKGFLEIAEDADEAGTYDESLSSILRLLKKAARERDTQKTHLLTVSLHAFLFHKGGHYALPTCPPPPPPQPPRLTRRRLSSSGMQMPVDN